MNGVEQLAMMLKGLENPPAFAPVYGVVEDLPDVKIRINSKIQVRKEQIKSLIDLSETDNRGNYVLLGKQVAMLPYGDHNKYLVLGVVIYG